MKYQIKLNGKCYEVSVHEGEAIVENVSDVVAAPAPAPVQAPQAAPAAPQAAVAGNAVKSPMPGKIVKVLCKAGDSVKKGQPLMVLEAMKMENDINATCDGVVKQVAVEVGTSVQTGTTLVVL